MDSFKLIKKNIILIILTILMLISDYIFCSYNSDVLKSSSDSVANIIGLFGSMILPYIVISIVMQILVTILTILCKKYNVFGLIIEIVYLIFISITVIPFSFLNLVILNEVIAYTIISVFIAINVLLIVLMIKRIVMLKGKDKNENSRLKRRV